MSREDLLKERQRIDAQLAELDCLAREEQMLLNTSKQDWDCENVFLVSCKFSGTCSMGNASALIKVYLTHEHALTYHPREHIKKVPIGTVSFVWMDLEHREFGEGMH